jgi:hypothetical protein
MNSAHLFSTSGLLLLLLSSGTHVLLKSAIGDLETSQSPQTNAEQGEQDKSNDDSHEDTCKGLV